MTLLLILLHCFLYKQARNYEVLIFCLLNKTVKPTDFLLFNLKHYCSCVVCFFFSLAKHRPDWIFCQTNLFYSTYQEKVWKQRLRFERKAHAQGLQLSLRLNSTLQGEGRNRTYGIHFWLPKNTLKSQAVVLSLVGLFWKALSDEQKQAHSDCQSQLCPFLCSTDSPASPGLLWFMVTHLQAQQLPENTGRQSRTLGELLSDIGVMATGQPVHKQPLPVHETWAPNLPIKAILCGMKRGNSDVFFL